MTWQKKLLSWYGKHKRDLPWRRTQDPYAIWVSEIMLQQTTVEAVIPYYERFLKKFPSVTALAESQDDEVLALWAGLGYYSRARNLHKAAQTVVKSHSKKIPDTVEGLLTLSGIGRYTAGAIASIAFGRRAPIVDGNVIRVLSRLYAIADDPKSTVGQKEFWKRAEEVLPRSGCGDFNQALMELGATICSPENPACLICPVHEDCEARRLGRPEEFPKGKKKTDYRDVILTAAIIQKENKILFVKRPQKGLLKGMWELPMVEGDLAALQKSFSIEPCKPLKAVKHSVLNKRLKIFPFLCRLKKSSRDDSRETSPKTHKDRVWLAVEDLSRYAMSSMNHKIIKGFIAAGPDLPSSDTDRCLTLS